MGSMLKTGRMKYVDQADMQNTVSCYESAVSAWWLLIDIPCDNSQNKVYPLFPSIFSSIFMFLFQHTQVIGGMDK